jgi:RNA-directed DNA polymerase
VEGFLEQLRQELSERRYRPERLRKVEKPKEGGRVGQLSIPSIRDPVVQGALKLMLEPIFEADFQPGSIGYRPKKTAHAALQRVSEAIVKGKTDVIDLDLRSYFGAPGKAGRFQRVRFPHWQGEQPPHQESSLGLVEVTT